MDTILEDIVAWFLAREPALRIFADHDCRVEGWFKGEMLLCLEDLRRRGRVREFEREFTIGKRGWGEKDQKKIDFRVAIDGIDHLCELKALCISQAYGTGRNLDFYFRKESAVGLWKDFRKLESTGSAAPTWILSFIYPAPTRRSGSGRLSSGRALSADGRV